MSLDNDVNLNILVNQILPQDYKESKSLSRLEAAVDKAGEAINGKHTEVMALSDYLKTKYIEISGSKKSLWPNNKAKDKRTLEKLIAKLDSISELKNHHISLSSAKIGNTRCFSCETTNPLSKMGEKKTVATFQEVKEFYQRQESWKIISELKDSLVGDVASEKLEKTAFIPIQAVSEMRILTDKFPIYILPNGTVHIYDEKGIVQTSHLDLSNREESKAKLQEIVSNQPDQISALQRATKPRLNARLGTYHEDSKRH